MKFLRWLLPGEPPDVPPVSTEEVANRAARLQQLGRETTRNKRRLLASLEAEKRLARLGERR